MEKEQQGTTEVREQKEKRFPEIVISDKTIQNLIYVVRGQQVMMDSDLAALYQVETKVFNQAVKKKHCTIPGCVPFPAY